MIPKMPIRSGTGFGNYDYTHKLTLDHRDRGPEGGVMKPREKMIGSLVDVCHVIKEVPSYQEMGRDKMMFESKLRPGQTDGPYVEIETPTPTKGRRATNVVNKSDTKGAVESKRFSVLTPSIDGSRFYTRNSVLDQKNGSRRRLVPGNFFFDKEN